MKRNTVNTVKILPEDNRMFDSKGNLVATFEPSNDLIEPYDPEYMATRIDKNPCKITRKEQVFLKLVARLELEVKHSGLPYEWNGQSFEILKYVESGYPLVHYLYVSDGLFCLGTIEEAKVWSKNAFEVITAAEKWFKTGRYA